jgi:hypothetical protein
VVYRAQEYPPLEAEEAVALGLFGVSVVSFAGCGVETVAGGRYPYLVHSGVPFFCGPGLGVLHHLRGRYLMLAVSYHIHLAYATLLMIYATLVERQ